MIFFSRIDAFIVRFGLPLLLSCCPTVTLAQTPPGLTLTAGAFSKKADEFLASLRPSTSVLALESGNDLLLEFPSIAAAGPVRFKIVSTMPRTDGLWLLSLNRQPESGTSLFAAIALEPSTLPEVTLLLNLSKTQPILLVARAGGKYYGLLREIKIGQPTTIPTPK